MMLTHVIVSDPQVRFTILSRGQCLLTTLCLPICCPLNRVSQGFRIPGPNLIENRTETQSRILLELICLSINPLITKALSCCLHTLRLTNRRGQSIRDSLQPSKIRPRERPRFISPKNYRNFMCHWLHHNGLSPQPHNNVNEQS